MARVGDGARLPAHRHDLRIVEHHALGAQAARQHEVIAVEPREQRVARVGPPVLQRGDDAAGGLGQEPDARIIGEHPRRAVGAAVVNNNDFVLVAGKGLIE